MGTLPTLGDVAARSGVSMSTASRALTRHGSVAPATRQRVERAALELGYVADANASRLVTGRSQAIGVIVPQTGTWYFDEVLRGIQEALLTERLDLVLYSAQPGTEARDEIFHYFMGRKRLDGILAVGVETGTHEFERLVRFGLPLVTVGGLSDGTSAVAIDDESASRWATEHLIQLGHANVTFIGGDPDGSAISHGDSSRLEGYLQAMRRAGLSRWIRHVRSAGTMPAGHDCAVGLLADRERRPTGLVAVTDEVAMGAALACTRLGLRVSEDVSIVGIDDHPHAQLFNLTTVRQQPADHGRRAAGLLLRHIQDAHSPVTRIVEDTHLVVRASTGPPSHRD